MPDDTPPIIDRLVGFTPFGDLPPEERDRLAPELENVTAEPGAVIFEEGAPLRGLYLIESGAVNISSANDELLTRRGPGDLMGERGLLRDGQAVLTARACEPTTLILIPAGTFRRLVREVPGIEHWFERSAPSEPRRDNGPYSAGLMALQVSALMTRTPLSCAATASVTDVARIMRDHRVSSVLVMDGAALTGIVTVHDLTNKILAEGRDGTVPVAEVMTPEPHTIAPAAAGLDALMTMAEQNINHLPVADARGRIIGMVGRTDLFRQQATTASHMASEIVSAESVDRIARILDRVPELLRHLVAASASPQAISRRITDLTDAATKRLLTLAEAELGPPPVPYLWAACGSQGRREQTGVSDQDNCLILDDTASAAHEPYFEALARFVSDGLNAVGFVYCPGDMMATNPRWRQPRSVWQSYFEQWIREPDNEAQMLASVMFDLRPIAGDMTLFRNLQQVTLDMARRNSIFVQHIISNALKHTPPLGLFRGFALIRSGEHRNTIDLKHSGTVPIVDLARVYALAGGISAIGTEDRIEAAGAAGIISESGARDLLDAWDLIGETRLWHQANQIAEGRTPDNFLAPTELSELHRNHLRDAFLVVRTMQSAASQTRMG
jgi:CBS domain-containing protein